MHSNTVGAEKDRERFLCQQSGVAISSITIRCPSV